MCRTFTKNQNLFFSCYQHVQKNSYLLQKLLRNPPLENEKVLFTSNPIPHPEYLYLSISAFFANLTEPNKEFLSVGSLLFT